MRLVYYSLSVSRDGRQERQLIESLKSLRRHNRTIPVVVFVYGSETPRSLREVARRDVLVTTLGGYQSYLGRISPHAGALALHPCLHKVLSLRHLPAVDLSQILYLDCDTFFAGDVEVLFDRYRVEDSYAREEPGTHRSRRGPDRAHLDERSLRALAGAEGLEHVEPFNSGVWLLNNGLWQDLDRVRAIFLDFAWRLLVGRYLAGGERTAFDLRLGAAIVATATHDDWSRALPYPSRNVWIVDQVALWLTLGTLSRSHGLLAADDVLQSAEFMEISGEGRRWIVAHYFSTMEQVFRETIGGGFGSGPRRQAVRGGTGWESLA